MQQAPSLLFLLVLLTVAMTAPVAWAFNCCRAADINEDGVVDDLDVAEIDAHLGSPCPRRDLDGDGSVDEDDRTLVEGFHGVSCAGYCRADLDGDNMVGALDRSKVEDALFQICVELPECAEEGPDCERKRCRAADLNRNGTVELSDLWFLLSEWGTCPGPSETLPSSAAFPVIPPNPCAQDPEGR